MLKNTLLKAGAALVLTGAIVGGGATAAQAEDQYYFDPITFTYSRAQVETFYGNIGKADNLCKFLPLNYPSGLACNSGNQQMREAFTKAHYQEKRVQLKFYRSKGCSSCSKSEYRVF